MFGAWWSFPFAGLEVAGLALAFLWWDRHADDQETVEVSASHIAVCRQSGTRCYREEFPRAWAQVERQSKPQAFGQPRKLIRVRAEGREAWFGSFMNESAVEGSFREVRARLARN